MADRIEAHVFAEVAQLVRTMVPDGVGQVHTRSHRRGVKVWFGPSKPTREHYEAQLIPRRLTALDRTVLNTAALNTTALDGTALEIGFHAEHPDEAANQSVADRLKKTQKTWRKELGSPAELDTFYGRDSWRRLSELWTDVDELDDDPDAAFEIACRLIDYISVVEPLRVT